MQSVFRFTFKDLFQHFFLRVHLRYWKKVIGSAMPRRGGVSMHTFDNHEEFEFCETPGMKNCAAFPGVDLRIGGHPRVNFAVRVSTAQ